MIRDPLAELWARAPRRRSSGSLTVPVKHPATGTLVWLSVGQWMTLLWLRRRMRYGRGETTLVLVGAATGAHAGTVTHRLDRLAQLGLIGRRSRPGRGHRTIYWPARSTAGVPAHRGDCRRHTHARRPGPPPVGLNVAPSTASGGLIRAYVSRGGLIRAANRSGSPTPALPAGGSEPRIGRRRPPRLIYEQCPRDGGAVRLVAWRFRQDSARLVALWDGVCPRCGSVVIAPLVIDLPGDTWQLPTAGDVLAAAPIRFTGDGRRHPRAVPPSIPPGPRLERIRDLAAAVIAGAEVDPDQAGILGARWLGWRPERIPQPAVIAGDVAELTTLRAAAWSAVRDWRPVRYSQPTDDDDRPI